MEKPVARFSRPGRRIPSKYVPRLPMKSVVDPRTLLVIITIRSFDISAMEEAAPEALYSFTERPALSGGSATL